jgi:cell division septation protein DedD
MMSVRVFSMVALIAAATATWVLPVDAQTTRFREPAEFPPASFTGTQYVDSNGCIFVRAGVAGATRWVPRVTSNRQNLCGAQPTFANGAPASAGTTAQAALPPSATLITAPPVAAAGAAASTPPVAAAVRPVQRPAAARVEPAAPPRPAARVNARVAPQPPVMAQRPGAPMRTIASITTPPALNRAPQTAAARPAAGQLASTTSRCAAGVRCGPQTQDPISRADGTGRRVDGPVITLTRREQARLDPQTRIVPRHVAEAQANAASAAVVPPGYRPAWQDDRLNPYRAQGTVAGKAAMDLVWTQTVPRRLIDRRSGRDMTAFNPNLVYPYTDLATQVRAAVPAGHRVTVSTSGTQKAKPQRQVAQAPRLSTRAAPPPAPKAVTGRFVQVGAFADPANADRTIRRLQAAGLPVSIQRSSSKGKPVQVILAGPFGNAAALSQGLGAARAAGFRDAFARN